MDPFDEFEFKPLTDGLGFHKKTVSLREGLETAGVVSDKLQGIPTAVPGELEDEPRPAAKEPTFEDVLSALEKSPLQRKSSGDLEFTEPLPREAKRQAMEVEVPRPTSPNVRSPFPRPQAYKGPAPAGSQPQPAPAVGTRRGAADSPPPQLVPVTMSLPSAILDLVVVTALALVFLAALLTVTKVDLNAVIRNLNRDFTTQIALAIMFLAVMQMYVVISRSFFGATLGEWTFDLQIGRDEERAKEGYPLRVAFRSVLVTLTGLILLPLVSAIFRRDIAGRISGVQLFRHKS